MRYLAKSLPVLTLLMLFATTSARAQTGGGTQQQGQGGGAAQLQAAGLTQTGQSDAFVIQRDANQSVAAVADNFLSRANASTTRSTQFGSVQGFGSLSGGTGSLTSSLIGGTTLGGAIGRGIGSSQFGGSQFGGQFGQATQSGAAGSSGPIRHRIRVGFDYPRPVATQVSRQFSVRLTKLPGLSESNLVTVAMDGSTAVLTGTVASVREAELVGRLATLEPGIVAVRNELTVEGSADGLPLPPPANSPPLPPTADSP